MAGLSFPIPNMPGLSATAEYRFMNILGGEKFAGSLATAGGTVPATIKLGNQFNHSLMLGIRYAFYVPPPPAPPAPAAEAVPAAAPARSYLVFFDWDKATLTDRARQIVKEAAESSTRVQYTRIEVNGYTDTSGTPHYNQRLSVRRAQAVAAELVKDGVPRNAIAITGFGETHLLVPTGPGVREAQNRRVEIIIK
jgi:outer membrane protein OmpA-like peptidoglycan-associated protein